MKDGREPYSPAPLLGRAHLAIGIAGVLIFLATGRYMDTSLAHLRGMADAPRALYRSGHIYILLISLMHLLLGSYTAPRSGALGRGAQYLASFALTAALALFVYGFWVETPLGQVERPMTRIAIELALAGTLLHCLTAAVFPARRCNVIRNENADRHQETLGV